MKLDTEGMPVKPTEWEPYGTAHGYVTLFIKAHHVSQLKRIAAKISYTDFEGVNPVHGGQYNEGNLSQWFGGRFDWIATLPGNDVNIFPGQFPSHIGNGNCRGDNRMVAWYDAKEVMEALGID